MRESARLWDVVQYRCSLTSSVSVLTDSIFLCSGVCGFRLPPMPEGFTRHGSGAHKPQEETPLVRLQAWAVHLETMHQPINQVMLY
jgi:hypothetical protein